MNAVLDVAWNGFPVKPAFLFFQPVLDIICILVAYSVTPFLKMAISL